MWGFESLLPSQLFFIDFYKKICYNIYVRKKKEIKNVVAITLLYPRYLGVAELAYAADLKSAAERIGGSIPLPETT